ncbi:MAG: hypothetical protein U0529_15580 [Thermoanaerobaculia bacterium]
MTLEMALADWAGTVDRTHTERARALSAHAFDYDDNLALAADAFAAFTRTGEVFDQGTAQAFRELLSRSGGEDPAVLYRRFRGRDVDLGPLLRRLGFDDTAPAAEPVPSLRATPGSPRP